MKYLTIGAFNLPLCALLSCSYSKRAHVVETSKNTFVSRGMECREIALSFFVSPILLNEFNECNGGAFADGSSLLSAFCDWKPDRKATPFAVFAGGEHLCPELLFLPTSITRTLQADRNGNVQSLEVSATLSGVARAKQSARVVPVSYDNKPPSVRFVFGDKSVNCQNDISIAEMEATPRALRIRLLLGTSQQDKSSRAWIFQPAAGAFFDVDGLGRFYIKHAETDENSAVYECGIFKDDAAKTRTFFDTTLNVIAEKIGAVAPSIPIDNYTQTTNDEEALERLAADLGLCLAYDKGKPRLFELVEPSGGALNYYISSDVVSSPTGRVTWRDGVHEFTAGNGLNNFVINSTICTPQNRAARVLDYITFYENEITLAVPFDEHIKHFSAVRLQYDGGELACFVTDYKIDFIANLMNLRLNYRRR